MHLRDFAAEQMRLAGHFVFAECFCSVPLLFRSLGFPLIHRCLKSPRGVREGAFVWRTGSMFNSVSQRKRLVGVLKASSYFPHLDFIMDAFISNKELLACFSYLGRSYLCTYS